MRTALLELLSCPACRRGSLLPEAAGPQILFGPVRCEVCGARFPVSEGIVDLGPQESSPRSSTAQSFAAHAVARNWDRWLRPALLTARRGRGVDAVDEARLYRSLLGDPQAPVLDLGCGTGALLRTLAVGRDLPPLLGLDGSRAMLEEAVGQTRESGVAVDYVRAQPPLVPLRDGALGGALQVGSLTAFDDVGPLFREVFRILAPGARYVISEWLPGAAMGLQTLVGLHPRTSEEIDQRLAAAGFKRVERLHQPPFDIVCGARLTRS